MIVARNTGDAALAARLTRKAAALASARQEERRRARQGDPHRWRMPHLLWPLFTTGD